MAIAASICLTGTLSQYAESPTLENLANRSVPGRTEHTLPPLAVREALGIDGYMAEETCAGFGQVRDIYAIDANGAERHLRLMVFDCSGDAATTSWMRRKRILGEVDYWIARDLGMLGRGIRAKVCSP